MRAHLQPSKAGRVLCPLPCDPNPRHAQAKKEGDAEVVRRLEEVLKVAMAEKQKTLRPEIQLLNRLLAAEGSTERRQVRAGDTGCMRALGSTCRICACVMNCMALLHELWHAPKARWRHMHSFENRHQYLRAEYKRLP